MLAKPGPGPKLLYTYIYVSLKKKKKSLVVSITERLLWLNGLFLYQMESSATTSSESVSPPCGVTMIATIHWSIIIVYDVIG